MENNHSIQPDANSQPELQAWIEKTKAEQQQRRASITVAWDRLMQIFSACFKRDPAATEIVTVVLLGVLGYFTWTFISWLCF